MKRSITLGEALAIVIAFVIPSIGWGINISVKVAAAETNIQNMERVYTELLITNKEQNTILTAIKVSLATKQEINLQD